MHNYIEQNMYFTMTMLTSLIMIYYIKAQQKSREHHKSQISSLNEKMV